MHFLVADDDPVQRTLLARMIERLGHSADMARDGQEAVASIHIKEYDAVLLDIHMPAMNGFEAARLMSREARRPFIAMLTADVDRKSRTAGFVSGADAVLTKPVRLDTLRDLLSSIVASGDASAAHHGLSAGSIMAPGDIEPDEPTLDLDVLRRFRTTMGAEDTAFIHELEEDFLRDAGGLCETISRAGERQDFEAMARAAHTLKSNSAMFGAVRLARHARSLEKLADAGSPYPWQPLHRRVLAELHSVSELLTSAT